MLEEINGADQFVEPCALIEAPFRPVLPASAVQTIQIL